MIRIVKLEFDPKHCQEFEAIFEEKKQQIRNFEGCLSVSLLQDKKNKNIFFTYSNWLSEEALENYRQSDLFTSTWKAIKPWFNNKPEAWSVESHTILN